MILQFKNLKPGKNIFTGVLNREELEWSPPLPPLKDRVQVKLIADKRPKLVILTLQLTFKLKLVCSRCLEEYVSTFNESSIYLIRWGKEEILPEKHLSDEDIVTIWTMEEEIDVNPFIRETMVLAIPMKPLCSPDCKGLCPICGANLNKERCEHTKEEITFKITKLSSLKDLLKGG